MDGTPFRGGSRSARDKEVTRDDAIRADPKLFQFWKDRYHESYEAGRGGPDGFEEADKALDDEIERRRKKKSRAEKRFPANDNGGE
jgi:hypothetical protein